jgi:hypothetical protein
MTFTATSREQVAIRLTDERWTHIVEEHCELAGMLESILDAVESADLIYEGALGEKLAAKLLGDGKYLVVVYRETGASDGFVITAFLTRRINYLQKRRRLWP